MHGFIAPMRRCEAKKAAHEAANGAMFTELRIGKGWSAAIVRKQP